MRSPWVGSLALLAPAHGFVAPSSIGRSGISMLQALVRPPASIGSRAASSRCWSRQSGLRLQRSTPSALPNAGSLRMAGGGGGGGGGGSKEKKEKVKKPESYYKKTVILPQTEFQQVGAVCVCL